MLPKPRRSGAMTRYPALTRAGTCEGNESAVSMVMSCHFRFARYIRSCAAANRTSTEALSTSKLLVLPRESAALPGCARLGQSRGSHAT